MIMKLVLRRISEGFTDDWNKHVFSDDLLNYFICSLNLLEEGKTYEIDFSKAHDLSEQSPMFPKGHYFEIEDINTIAKEVKQ